MTPEKAQSLISTAYKQQQLTGNRYTAVSFVIPGKWPDRGSKKRLNGKGGPLGDCLAEYEDSVLCAFRADEVISYAAKFLPVIKLSAALSEGDQ